MNLRYITCSDIRENISINEIINLLRTSSKAELGIQAQSTSMNSGMPRRIWLNEILKTSDAFFKPLNIAIHVNYDWCSDFCSGNIPQELKSLLDRKHKNRGEPIIKRWQLNLGDGTIIPDAKPVADIIKSYPYQEFIFTYNNNPKLQKFVQDLNKTGVNFSLLFDASYGAGISPANWESPVYQNHSQGYAGGLSPENVANNLDKISKVAGNRTDVWIDAEGKLMKPGTRQFDLIRAGNYIKNALAWEQKQR